MPSQLIYSEALGRQVRTGPAAALGNPTSELVLEATVAGRVDEAHEYLRYLIEETERVYGIFTTWLRELRTYAQETLADPDAHYARLTEELGCEPPLVERAQISDATLAACRAAIASADRGSLNERLGEVREQLRAIHDSQAEWCWALLTLLRDELGEDRMDEVFRRTQEPWVTARYEALGALTPQQIFELTIEGMRGHLTGPNRVGQISVDEDEEKFVLSFDPCGSGGRMRRGDPSRGQLPAAERPDVFGVTTAAHDWSWGEADVCLYCAHCAVVNEILPIERLGAPMRVTDYPKHADGQCRWTIYKSRESVPQEAYRRVGK